jgi:MATE family multidrug resistance protein
MPALGIGFAVCTLVGNAIGEGRPDLARRRTALGAVVAMIYMGALGAVFLFKGEWLMDIFSNEPQVIRIGAQLLIFAALFQLFDAVCLVYSNALRGAGDTLWPMVVGPALSWSLLIGGAQWIAHARPEYGSAGPWAFAALFVIALGIAFWLRWRGGNWNAWM